MNEVERFERELRLHGNMHIHWIDDHACLFFDANDPSDKGLAVVKDGCVTFYDLTNFFNRRVLGIEEYEHEEDDPTEFVIVDDVDLCVDDDCEDDSVMRTKQLEDLCVEHRVICEMIESCGPSGWPTYRFEGISENVKEVFKALGLDDVDEMVDDAHYEPENVLRMLHHVATFFPDYEIDETHLALYVSDRLVIWFDAESKSYREVDTIDKHDRHSICEYALELSKRSKK